MEFKKTLLIGARGVGKSSLLERWPGTQIKIDLDEEITNRTQHSVWDLFKTKGEKYFRELEQKTLTDLLQSKEKLVIAVGAGFQWTDFEWPIPKEEIEVLWIRRTSDALGRIFTDRPRLENKMDELEEFHHRYQEREPGYRKIFDRSYQVPEGLKSSTPLEEKILFNKLPTTNGILTLTPDNSKWRWSGPVEIRTDFWEPSQWPELQKDQTIWSIRNQENFKKLKPRDQDLLDWPLEYGDPVVNHPQLVLSLHHVQHGEGLIRAADRLLKNPAWHYKLSPVVSTWNELDQGLRWQQQDPENRSFLPRSKRGQWKWFRLLMANSQKMNFVQDGLNAVADQPNFYDWFSIPPKFKFGDSFAAVLGDPISHSHSPAEQGNFFGSQGWPFFGIQISKEEWTTALPRLRAWGLRAAAVTAPLKHEVDPSYSLNTVFWDQSGQMSATNTDRLGFAKIFSEIQNRRAVIWGGGGTLSSVLEHLPKAAPYSVRTGKPKLRMTQEDPQVLVWAAGPRDSEPQRPQWRPQLVIDLNYREDSQARSYALKIGAQYKDGSELFRLQAQGQREFWKPRIEL